MTARSDQVPLGETRAREIVRVANLLRSEADRTIISLGLTTVAVAIASGALAALSPLVLKSFVDAVAAPPRADAVGRLSPALACGAAYPLLLFMARVLADIRPVLNGRINQRIHSRLTLRFFDHVQRLPMGYLLRRKSGELLHALDLASTGAQLLIGHLVGSLLPVLVELFTMTMVLIRLGQPTLLAVTGVAALAYLAIFWVGARRMVSTAHEVSKASMKTYEQLSDGLNHFETLRYFAAEDEASRRLRRASATLEERWRSLDRLNVAIALAASVIVALSTAVCLRMGADAVARNAMTVGGLVLITVYMLQMVRPLESIGTAARDFARGLGGLRPMLELLSEPPSESPSQQPLRGEPRVSPGGRPPCRAPAIRLENLHFGYDPRHPLLKGVDFDVPAGSTTAIVGRSGSGKSSVARLLMRLYAPQQGHILLDGRPIDAIDAARLRQTVIGLVPQETALLHATIAENIALGAPTASPDEIRAAVRGARLDELLDTLPLGLDTPVGERGMQLSGGERQRVGIARALLRRPGLYVLDEPTSMLDSRTEREIQEALRTLTAGATKIVIAHRLSTIVDADEIVVLDDGRIGERGSHPALLTRNGLYAQMWREQMAGSA